MKRFSARDLPYMEAAKQALADGFQAFGAANIKPGTFKNKTINVDLCIQPINEKSHGIRVISLVQIF